MALKAVLDTLDGLDEHVAALYTQRGDKFEIAVEIPGIEGIKSFTDFGNLNKALQKERADHRAIKDRFAPLGDRKPDEILSILDRVPELELKAAGALDETKLEAIVNGRITGKLAPVERELQTTREALLASQTEIQGYKQKDIQRTIGDSVRSASSKSHVVESAVEDVTLLAERVFTLDETGKVVTKENVGCTPGISPEVWLNEMQSKRPHWWGPSGGGGAGGAGGQRQFTNNPWSNENWNLTEQGKILTENPSRADQLAKSAGTTVGGRRPTGK
jgi:hypothetical protein